MLIDDFKPESDEFVLGHDFGARLPCLVNCVSQVIDLNANGVARNVMINVHVEEVAGHRRDHWEWKEHAAPMPGSPNSGSVGNEWQPIQSFEQSGNSGTALH
jgi:hypothetical protein